MNITESEIMIATHLYVYMLILALVGYTACIYFNLHRALSTFFSYYIFFALIVWGVIVFIYRKHVGSYNEFNAFSSMEIWQLRTVDFLRMTFPKNHLNYRDLFVFPYIGVFSWLTTLSLMATFFKFNHIIRLKVFFLAKLPSVKIKYVFFAVIAIVVWFMVYAGICFWLDRCAEDESTNPFNSREAYLLINFWNFTGRYLEILLVTHYIIYLFNNSFRPNLTLVPFLFFWLVSPTFFTVFFLQDIFNTVVIHSFLKIIAMLCLLFIALWGYKKTREKSIYFMIMLAPSYSMLFMVFFIQWTEYM
ncbi:hypothetical protein [Ostreibacterium oceani]|uniref:Uncharacterized protein n=1 Tax=Ostreibacterium oceani TaxID=2654998 RepID=A0A6N7EZ92_9GAMM|nr:hypothetical protein [Ostreibacterium oceani]MPV86679.1 hypothetical protein [Ostreibacterium oceani]